MSYALNYLTEAFSKLDSSNMSLKNNCRCPENLWSKERIFGCRNPLRKTKKCRYFSMTGHCSKGSSCTYIHDQTESEKTADRYVVRLARPHFFTLLRFFVNNILTKFCFLDIITKACITLYSTIIT